MVVYSSEKKIMDLESGMDNPYLNKSIISIIKYTIISFTSISKLLTSSSYLMWMSVIFTCTFLITWVANFSKNVSFLASFGLSIKNRKIQGQELKFSHTSLSNDQSIAKALLNRKDSLFWCPCFILDLF